MRRGGRVSKIRARLSTRNDEIYTATAGDRGASATREQEVVGTKGGHTPRWVGSAVDFLPPCEKMEVTGGLGPPPCEMEQVTGGLEPPPCEVSQGQRRLRSTGRLPTAQPPRGPLSRAVRRPLPCGIGTDAAREATISIALDDVSP